MEQLHPYTGCQAYKKKNKTLQGNRRGGDGHVIIVTAGIQCVSPEKHLTMSVQRTDGRKVLSAAKKLSRQFVFFQFVYKTGMLIPVCIQFQRSHSQ